MGTPHCSASVRAGSALCLAEMRVATRRRQGEGGDVVRVLWKGRGSGNVNGNGRGKGKQKWLLLLLLLLLLPYPHE